MGWARLDDGFHDHPKVDELSLAAVGLWTLCLTHAHRHRRTAAIAGHVSTARVRKVAGRHADALSSELVAVGLWEVEDSIGGYVIHDFAEYLPKERDPDERRAAGRKGAAKRWQPDGKPDGNLPSTSMASDSSRASAPAFPSRPVPTPTPEQLNQGGERPVTLTRPAAQKRGTRLPDDWSPDQTLIETMRQEAIPDELARRELPKFRDYWLGVAGAKGVKADWPATWRNWLRRAVEDGRGGRPAPNGAGKATQKAAGWLTVGTQQPETLRALPGGSS